MIIHVTNMIIKILSINICIYYIFFKITNSKTDKPYIIKRVIIISMLTTIFYVLINRYINNIALTIIIFGIQTVFLGKESYTKSVITANLIANAFEYLVFTLSSIIVSFFKTLFKCNLDIFNFLFITIINVFLVFNLFRIRRINKGLEFLKDNLDNKYIDIIMINISVAAIFVYCLFKSISYNDLEQILFPFLLLGAIMIVMIQKTITSYYEQKLLFKTIEDYKSEIASKDEQIKKLSDEKFKISKLNHEFYNRQKALEKKVKDFVSNSNVEASSELSIMESINNLSKGYSSEIEKIKSLDKLPVTDIEEIDDMFKYMQSECKNNNIDFKLQINGNIHHMVNKIIPQDRLVTLIGDHLRDAIIAINAGDNKFRSILAILGVKDECYELCIYDSGVEFTIDTLSKLGIEQTTTHKDSGGSGMGFMTTFETMKQTGASLIIDEKCKPSENDYTKSVVIRFDGKNEYRIFSYRAKKIKNKIKDNRAIIKDRI